MRKDGASMFRFAFYYGPNYTIDFKKNSKKIVIHFG